MNGSILHILNGDGTNNSFVDAGIPGTPMVWHEALCEGPAIYGPTLDEFLSTRIPFLISHFEAESESYVTRFKNEWAKWEDLGPYSELVLWFEYDLFCQANLLFLCHLLHHRAPSNLKISLVSPADHPELPDFWGMGQLSPQQLAGLFPERIQLDRSDLEFADRAWRAWADGDLIKVYELSQNSPQNWPHLQEAIHAMVEELPAANDGLSETERLILDQLADGPKSPGALFRHFLSQRDVLGFGDLQFFKVMEGLVSEYILLKDNLYTPRTPIADLGSDWDIVPNRQHFDRWVGPVHITSFDYKLRWENVTQKIVYSS